MKFSIILGALAVTATSGMVLAGSHSDLPPAVKARQAHMQLNLHNIGTLVSMARGRTEYNAEAAAAAASNIAALSKLNQMSYWAPGTDSDSVAGSNALPALWENIPDAISKGQALTAAADNLAAQASNGLEAMQAALGPTGEACNACHKAYQKPN